MVIWKCQLGLFDIQFSGSKSFYCHSGNWKLQIAVIILSWKSSFSFVISEWIKNHIWGDWRVNNIRMFFFRNKAMKMWECTNIKGGEMLDQIFQERPEVLNPNKYPVYLCVEANISGKYFKQIFQASKYFKNWNSPNKQPGVWRSLVFPNWSNCSSQAKSRPHEAETGFSNGIDFCPQSCRMLKFFVGKSFSSKQPVQ